MYGAEYPETRPGSEIFFNYRPNVKDRDVLLVEALVVGGLIESLLGRVARRVRLAVLVRQAIGAPGRPRSPITLVFW